MGIYPSKYCYLSAINSFVYEFLNLESGENGFFVDINIARSEQSSHTPGHSHQRL